MRYVWNKKTGYVYPYSEALLLKKNIEELEEEKAKELLKEQQKGDIGFRDGGEAAAAIEAGKTAEQMRMAQMQQELADLKAQLEATAKVEASEPEPESEPESKENSVAPEEQEKPAPRPPKVNKGGRGKKKEKE